MGRKVTCDATAEAALAHSLARSLYFNTFCQDCKLQHALFSSMSVLQQYMYDAAGEICLETWRATNSRKSLSPRLPVLIASWPAGTDAGRGRPFQTKDAMDGCGCNRSPSSIVPSTT